MKRCKLCTICYITIPIPVTYSYFITFFQYLPHSSFNFISSAFTFIIHILYLLLLPCLFPISHQVNIMIRHVVPNIKITCEMNPPTWITSICILATVAQGYGSDTFLNDVGEVMEAATIIENEH